MYIVTALADTDLRKVIANKHPFTIDHVQWFMYQLFKACKFFHAANIAHRDLKPANIFLLRDCTVKIGDFGLARCLDVGEEEKKTTHTEYTVTRWYRAPEIVAGNTHYDTKIDMWSLGCIMAEIWEYGVLLPGKDSMLFLVYSSLCLFLLLKLHVCIACDQVHHILSLLGTPSEEDLKCIEKPFARSYIAGYQVQDQPPRKYVRPDWKTRFQHMTPDALDLLEKLLEFNPKKRWSAEQCLEHPFIKKAYSEPKCEPRCTSPKPVDFFSKRQATEQELQGLSIVLSLLHQTVCCG